MSIVGTLSAVNGNLSSTLTNSDLLNPTLDFSYSDDYQLTDVIVGKSVTIALTSDEYDTYLQLINADTGEVIKENDDYGEELNSQLSFVAVEEVNYIVRVSGYDGTELGIYQLSAASTEAILSDGYGGDGYGGDGYGGDGYGGDGYGGDGYGGDGYGGDGYGEDGYGGDGYGGDGINTISVFNGYLVDTLTNSDSLQPTLNGAYSDDYLLTDVVAGQLINIDLLSFDFDTYLQLIDADTGEIIAEDDGYFFEAYTSKIEFYAAEGFSYIVRASGIDETELGTYALFAGMIAPKPDLIVIDNISIPAPVSVHSTTSVSWTVQNIGEGSASGDWDNTVILSKDEFISEDDVYVGYGVREGSQQFSQQQFTQQQSLEGEPLFSGESYNVSSIINIDNAEPGSYYLLFTANESGELPETNLDNNVVAVPIEISGVDVDLEITATASQDVTEGESINISWTVNNSGSTFASNNGLWQDRVYLSDDSVFDPDDLQIVEKLGYYGALASGDSYTTAIQNVTLSDSVKAGSYYLFFVADDDNNQYETDETNNVAVLPIQIVPADINLTITDTSVPFQTNANNKVSVSVEVTNTGTVTTEENYWRDRVYWSTDDVYDASDIELDSIWTYVNRRNNPLAPGETYTKHRNFDVPDVESGTYYILFHADSDEIQRENNETDNVTAVAIEVAPSPNLVITSTDVPKNNTGIAGDRIDLSWTVTNSGDAPALRDYWYDEVYLSEDEYLDVDDTNLVKYYDLDFSSSSFASGESYTVDQKVYLPKVEAEDYYLIFHADSDELQGETNEADNIKVVPFEIVAPANLVVSDAAAPAQVDPDYDFSISWTVTNIGDVPTSGNNWFDRVYLSRDGIYDDSDLEVASGRRGYYSHSSNPNARLGAGESYIVEGNITLDDDLDLGNYYLLFITDDYDDNYHNHHDDYSYARQAETDETDNIRVVPIEVIESNTDLNITPGTVPESAKINDTITIDWTVTNEGTDVALASSWTDKVYVSNDQYLDASDLEIDAQTKEFETLLGVGDSYTTQRDIYLSNDIEVGNKYLLFVADSDNEQIETNEINNIKAIPISLDVPDVDLSLTVNSSPASAVVQSKPNISWTVTNKGTETAKASSWRNYIYISDDEIYDDGDQYIGDSIYDNDVFLEAGQSYSQSRTIDIPKTEIGEHYLLFISDFQDSQSDINKDNNTVAVPIDIKAPNLVVSGATAPIAANKGSEINTSWITKNIGDVPALANYRSNYVYLSKNENYDESDQYLIDYSGSLSRNYSLAPDSSYYSRADLEIPDETIPGNYYLLFYADKRDYQGETDESDNVTALPIEVFDTTNIEISDVDTPSSAILDDKVTVSWTVSNTGLSDASATWYDYIYLSEDEVYDSNDAYAGSYRYEADTIINAGESFTATHEISISESLGTGDRYLLFIADHTGIFPENDETDNIYSVPISLDVTNLELTDAPNVPTSVSIYETLDLSWIVTNTGTGRASSYWFDEIYLSEDENYDNSDEKIGSSYHNADTPLNSGASYEATETVNIPNSSWLGNQYILFITDEDDYQAESDETDNVLALPIEIKAANLVVTDVVHSQSITTSGIVSTSLTVSNVGDVNLLNQGRFITNTVYLSDDEIFDLSDRDLGTSYTYITDMAVNESYTAKIDATIPHDAKGSKYLIFAIDDDQDLIESNNNDNYYTVPIEIITPNLTLSDSISPDWAGVGQTIPISWTVTNNSEVQTVPWSYEDDNTYWDRIYLSSDPLWDNDDTLVDEKLIDLEAPLAPGDSYTVSQEITLPNGQEGEQYLLFVTDTNNRQGETDETDNVRTVPIVITNNGVNLQLTEANAPATAILGETIAVDWSTVNVGGISASLDWLDRVYLSDDTTLDNTDFRLNEQATGSLSPLAPGNSYGIGKNVTIPLQGAGTRYLIFKADDENDQIETDDNDNTYVLPIELLAPNLTVTSPVAPNAAFLGESIDLTWTIANIGIVDAFGSRQETVYISDDQYLDIYDEPLSYNYNSSLLKPGTESTTDKNAEIPRTTIGDRYLLFVADSNNVQGETDETDNLIALPIKLTALDIDLVVSDISAPLESFAGEEVEVVWTVTNNGSEDATGTWSDGIYLISDTSNIQAKENYFSYEFTGTVAAGQSIERRQKITLPQTLEGDFKIVVQTDVNDSLIEYGKEDNNLRVREASFTSILPTFANLQVSQVIAPVTAFSSQSTVVEWTVTNVGDAATSAPLWEDKVWLSLDQNYDNNDIELGQAFNTSYLNPGDSYTNSLEVALPQDIEGKYYFLVQTDWGGSQVFEFQNENDNLGISNISDIELTPPPDLKVRVNAPSNAFSGELTGVSWTVTNEGQGRTLQSSWYDEVYLSTDTKLDSSDEYLGRQNHSGVLEPGESYTVNEFYRLFKLPEGVSGDYYFIVRTDAGSQVFESVLSSNNTGFDETVTQVFLTPPPDIEISLDAPDTGLASNEIILYYSSSNYGATPVTRGSWSNNFYLSEDEQFDSGSDILLGSRSSYETYGAGSSYLNKSIVVQLPDGLSGDYYIFAQADGENRVFELDKDNNVAFDTITIDSQPADLIVSEVTANDVVEAGTAAKISWTTINQGTGSTFETRWNDEIWLSADSIIGNGNDYLLGTFSHNGLLKPGESYSKSELITIPFYFQGDYQLYVKTDADDSVYEDNIEINNILNSSQITITRQTPDLQVNSVNAGISGISGESFFVEWTVINSGTGETNSNYWYDEVFLSLDQNINDKSDISLGKVYHSGSLEANESYKVGQTFELPQNLDRDYYVVVKTDVGDQVLETPLENNNETASSTTTSISLNAVPDLVFDFIDAPAQGISGQTFELSWKVSNQGADTSSGWTEVFYLSQDQVLDRDNDIYLGSSFNEEGLAAGAESSQTALFNISAGLSGPLYVFGVVDSLNSIFERGGEDNNIAYDGNSMNVILPDPADLTVGAVSVPNDGVPGQNITIDYTVSNQGDFTVNGNWEDAIYLSEDDQWDINDPLIEKVRVFDSVESGESYSRTVEAELPGVATGNYYVVARSDIRNHVYESDDDNNLAVSATQITVNPELLELGGSDTDTIRPGKSIYYRLEVSAGQAIRIKLDSQDNSSSNNVYVRYEQMPTKGQFDFFTEPFSADPEIVFPAEQDGTYYVLVTGDDSSAANDFTITAEEIPFSLLDVSTKQVGNVSPFTLEIEGAKFDADNTAFQIVDGSGTIYEATQVVFKNSTTAYATFDLSGQSIGNYDVRAIKNDGTSVVLEDILMVEEGIDAELFSSIEGPEVVRIWGKYFAKLNYANLGGADEAAPLIILQTPDTSLGLSADSIAPTESLFLLGVGEDLGADVLRAGEINQIPFFYAPGTSVNVSMLRYTEDSNTRINDSDWNTIETAIKPAAVVDEDWNKFWSTVQPRIGNTWGDYVQVVNDLAKAFSPEAERDYDVRELFAEWYESGDLSVYTPKSFVSGSLIDTETGEPLSNVELQLYQEIDGETIQNFNKVITNSDGAFAFSTLPPGNYKLAVANDYALVKSLSQNANSFESSYTFDISLGNDISNMELEVDLSPQTNEIEIQDDQLYQDFDFTQLLNDFEDWAQEENNSSSTLLNPAANTLSETSNIFPQNENDNLIENIEDRINIPTQVFNLPVIGEIKLKRQVVQEKTEDIRVIKGQNTLKQVAKLQEKSEIRFSGLEERLGISLPKIRYTADGKLTTKKEEEDCEWIDKEYKLEVGGSALEIKAEFETANSIITLLIPEPLRSAVVDFVVNGGDLFTTLSANWLSYSREWTRNAETGELSIKDKWKPSFAIEQFIGKQFGDFRYGLYTKFQIEPEITPFEDTKLNKFTASGEFYLALPVAGVFGYKLKLINDKDGFTTQYIRIDGNSIEIPAIEVPGDSPIPLPPGDDNPSLPSGFSALELIQSPESFFDFPEPPEIGHCDDEHEEDNGDLGDYNPAVLTSSDPNDILGPDGFGEEKWIDAEKTLDYTIRFENDPELATAPAQVVKITQQLDEDLDFRTFRLGDFGFGDTFIDVPDNRAFYQTRLDLVAEKGIYLDFFAGIDIATGEAFWELHSIDPATGEQPNNPLLGFLPPNLTKPEGDGFVSYSIRADRDIETGAVIDAEATIIFDVNEPIDTPPIFNTIDALKPSSTVEALPDLSDTKEFTVSWTGNDDPNGSAIADYTIYVAENSGEFTPWLENTTLTEALFTGTPGSSYQFYAVARDNAGNVEDIPNTPQAQTTIAGGNNPPLLLNPIDDLMIAENSNFSFTISDNVFFDSDEGDVLNFSAALADGTSLPLWLNFDGANQTFTGTPSSEDVRIYEIEVTATDSSNETATDLFTLEVEEVVEQAVFSTIGEFGQVSNFNHLRQTIEFNHSYDNPVVFALPLSRHGGDPATVRITNLESDRFTAYLQEPEYKDGWHVTENFSYLVLEAGDWVLEDGTLLEVGTVDTRKLTTQGWENLDFDLDFESTPAILSQVQTYNGNQFVRTRQRRASVDGFLLSMEEEEALKYSGHLTETVGWLAIETGTGVLGELEYQAGHTDKLVNHRGYTLDFEAEFDETPSLFASLASFYGGDSAGLRYRNLTSENVRIILEEEQSLDAETRHVNEIVDFLAISGTGDFLATAYETNELS